MSSRVLICVNETVLVERIASAHHRICYASPGLHDAAAKALIDAARRLGASNVRIIIDHNAEVCRLGYGTISAVQLLFNSGCDVRSCPGLRLGILLADDLGVVFAPTPQVLEPEPRTFETPNAMLISSQQAERLIQAIFPDQETAGKASPEIGEIALTEPELAAAVGDLLDRPPVAPDLLRQIRVLSSRFQLVKIEFEGSRVEQVRLRLKAKDLGISDQDVEANLGVTWKVFDKAQTDVLPALRRDLDEIQDRYLIPLGRFGQGLRYERREEFEREMKSLREKIESAKSKLKDSLREDLETSRNRLLSVITSSLKRNPPEELRNRFIPGMQPEQTQRHAEKLVDKAKFPSVDSLVGKIECHYDIFNISEQLLQNPDFVRQVEAEFNCPIEKLTSVEPAVGVRPGEGKPWG